ncbi:AzlD domain-containing protein [Laribacter hongkongensis]|jgi:branched-subunit amino acid transport protein|uniref:AzlD domain-containing protein n=2 Tax=Laribacter hongkongensis TaxID=168471 RepID=A0AAW5DU67_9NEIS|nr:AzlD domain-containing protein [Laribacter hongkongensis]MBE5529561.1 branched chain amino acid ABC transporter [Laribacter hongkongensis]MCG8996398.1 AzlD domain-containing protein [Laribacter hongkongensis]MCG9011226.1 AzlD domain-containing protein [Laribacter hongkongensis]MCG9023066.1 AzlD domain-containing protein [Laribacter hongkongensis]MCG9024965.1 AzlD domain-containing protein [Laribacter hongkongensis]
MNSTSLWITILGMALVTALLRALPITLLAGRQLPPLLARWLSFVPVTVLAALLLPDIVLRQGELALTVDNLFLWASLPTLAVAYFTRNFFGTMLTGMVTVGLARWLLPAVFGL